MLRNRLAKIITMVIAACVLAVAAPATANAEPVGQYTYVCVLTSGSSYTLSPGDNLSTCKGSYLQKYINGTKVQTINLTGYGAPADPNAISMDCLVAVIGTGAAVITLSGAVAFVGLAASVYGLKACKA